MWSNFSLPFLFDTKVTSRAPGRLEMTVIVRGAFRLAPGQPVEPLLDFGALALQGDVFGAEDDDRTGAVLHASDYADFKLRTDLLLRGACYPAEAGATSCTARFAVGEWSKSVRVFGRRVWTDQAHHPFSEPEPFDVMPITYANAFGGPGFAENPVGKGHQTAELPNVEDPAALLRSRRDRPAPACFGALSPSWPQRCDKLGAGYRRERRKTGGQFKPSDLDWSYFNSAPVDQQRPGYLRGDEQVVFEHLHPQAARFSACLPGIGPRVFVRRTDGFTGEVAMNLDTFVADLDNERGVLLWRGLVEVHDAQLDDVATLLVGSEPIAQPLPAAHYLVELEALDRARRSEQRRAAEAPPTTQRSWSAPA